MDELFPTYRLTHALPPRLTIGDDCLQLKAGPFTGCKPLAYFFFALGLFMLWSGLQLSQQGIERLYIYWGFLVLPTFAVAIWLFGHRVHWRLDRQVIQKLTGYRLTIGQEWQAEGIRAVEIVQQFHNATRFSQLAPGVHLLTRGGRRIDLGAHGNPETLHAIASAVAEFYAVPCERRTGDADFRKFRRRKLITLLAGLGIAAVIIIAKELAQHG